MKTFYKYHYEQQAQGRCTKFEAATGVKWEYYGTRGGFGFTPIVTAETALDSLAAVKLLLFLTPTYKSFVALHKISGLPLLDVLTGAKTLVHNQQAVPAVNRMGHFAAVRTKHKWEA